MGKRRYDETEEERKARKRAKKEAKKVKRESTDSDRDSSRNDMDNTESSFQRKTIRMIFSLYPSHLDDIMMEINRSLRQNLLKYVSGLNGILLAFDNVRIVLNGGRKVGVILNEQPHLHYLVDLDALVFAPDSGMHLHGVVTECFESHVGLLVHKFFNASVSSDHLTASGYTFDEEGVWIHDGGSAMIAPDASLRFEVEKVHECGGTISMEGKNPVVPYHGN
jgi:DNA-directed RNA polymerase subunit E'/Rpb7